MNKRTKSSFLVYAIILGVYLVIFLAIPFPKTATTWVCFAFTIVAIIASAGITYYAFSKSDELRSKVYGFPIFRLGLIYCVVQLITGAIICVIGIFIYVPDWIAVVVSVLILALSAIGVIAVDNTSDIITEQEKQTTTSIKKMNSFKLDIQYIVDSCTDDELKKQLQKLSEKFKYSDPVSCDELVDVESQLNLEVKALEALVNSDVPSAKIKAQSVEKLLADRNRRCKEYKK